MKILLQPTSTEVAGGRLASSAQPPRAPSFFTLGPSHQPTPQPFSSAPFLDTPGALLEGLRRFTAFRPLPEQTFLFGKASRPILR